MTEDSKPAFEAEFSPDLTHPNVVQTFKASSVPITVRPQPHVRCLSSLDPDQFLGDPDSAAHMRAWRGARIPCCQHLLHQQRRQRIITDSLNAVFLLPAVSPLG